MWDVKVDGAMVHARDGELKRASAHSTLIFTQNYGPLLRQHRYHEKRDILSRFLQTTTHEHPLFLKYVEVHGGLNIW